MPVPPESTKRNLTAALTTHARLRWPNLTALNIRFRGRFVYLAAELSDGDTVPLCRLRYTGSAGTWGFALYRASHDNYQDTYLPTGLPAGTPEQALACAGDLYLTAPGTI